MITIYKDYFTSSPTYIPSKDEITEYLKDDTYLNLFAVRAEEIFKLYRLKTLNSDTIELTIENRNNICDYVIDCIYRMIRDDIGCIESGRIFINTDVADDAWMFELYLKLI